MRVRGPFFYGVVLVTVSTGSISKLMVPLLKTMGDKGSGEQFCWLTSVNSWGAEASTFDGIYASMNFMFKLSPGDGPSHLCITKTNSSGKLKNYAEPVFSVSLTDVNDFGLLWQNNKLRQLRQNAFHRNTVLCLYPWPIPSSDIRMHLAKMRKP